MPASLLQLRVPGKLMVAGEYAVLEPHQPAVVVAVDRYLKATIALAPENRLSLPGFGILNLGWRDAGHEVRFERPDARLRFVAAALAVSLEHLRDQFLLALPFHLTLESELEDETGRKYGLGGSGAATVATVAAVLTLLRDDGEGAVPDETVFKLAAIAHLRAQGSGSGADVAASTYGGWLRYSSFQPEWLAERLTRGRPLYELLAEPWPFCSIERLSPLPRDLRLCVGWTGEPASTGELVPRVRALRETDPAAYGRFLAESQAAVEHLVAGLQSANPGRALAALERNRRALQDLGEAAGVPIETAALAELHRWAEVCGGGGKPSGAGGGDCGVALIFGAERAVHLQAAWRHAGLEPLALEVADAGVTVTRIEG